MDIKPHSDIIILLDREFDSFEELSHLAVQWDADFRQLSAVQYKSSVFQAMTGSILISNVNFGCNVEQRGSTPQGMRTFAVLDSNCSEVHWFGHIVSKDDLLIFPSHGDVDSFSQAGFNVTAISIPEELLAEFFEQNGFDNISKIMEPGEMVTRTSQNNINELRYLFQQLKNILQKKTLELTKPIIHLNNSQLSGDEPQNQILLSIFNIMTNDCDTNRSTLHDLSSHRRSHALQLIINYIKINNKKNIPIKTLCYVAQISERTLQYLFKRELGLTPKAYIKGQKLYSIHKELRSSNQFNVGITDIANKYGFWHMGQFAADYYKIYGELPSVTFKHSS
ncbi:MAG: helix-turn-helix domain-containing protein [gamma proteobacterium symbiont of Taylorina sp.]|nr:helix-turn-helix domain-containing protein [gamma proteobacterium symbiont of Taylorina sp.]